MMNHINHVYITFCMCVQCNMMSMQCQLSEHEVHSGTAKFLVNRKNMHGQTGANENLRSKWKNVTSQWQEAYYGNIVVGSLTKYSHQCFQKCTYPTNHMKVSWQCTFHYKQLIKIFAYRLISTFYNLSSLKFTCMVVQALINIYNISSQVTKNILKKNGIFPPQYVQLCLQLV